jgi:FkbM family methyltransferase
LFARYFIGDTATVKIEGLTLSVPARDGFGFRLLTQGNWEPFLMYLFKKSICPGMTVVDVGAHIGLYALVASTLVGPEGKVYAFEPELQNYDLLQKNIKANGFTNVIPLRKVVQDRPGTAKLYLHPERSELHSVRKLGKGAKAIVVEAISLDDFLVGQKVDVVKIDVEGAEMAVLQGMQRIISENQEIKVFWEFVPQFLTEAGADPRHFLAKLVAHGFTIYELDDHRREIVHVADVSRLLAERGCELFCTRGQSAPPSVP